MFLRRIFKGMPELGPWVAVAELLAAMATVIGTLMALNVVHNPFGGAPAGRVSGMVTDVRTGKAVPEATVQVVDSTSAVIAAESIPNAQGKWKETVKPGSYMVKAVCDGYAPSAKTVTVAASKERIVNLSIKPETKAEEQSRVAGGAVPQPTAAAVPKIVVVAPSGGGAGGAAAASAAPSDEQKARAEFDKAKKYQSAKKTDKAREALAAALQLDPGEGRYWAEYVNLEFGDNNTAQAQDLARDGLVQVTKNKGLLVTAADRVGVKP